MNTCMLHYTAEMHPETDEDTQYCFVLATVVVMVSVMTCSALCRVMSSCFRVMSVPIAPLTASLARMMLSSNSCSFEICMVTRIVCSKPAGCPAGSESSSAIIGSRPLPGSDFMSVGMPGGAGKSIGMPELALWPPLNLAARSATVAAR